MLRDDLLDRFPRLKDLPPDSYVVGGAIRDLILGIEPADVDIACNDPLAAARSISPRVIRLGTGEHLSAWRVVDGEHAYDFAEILDHDIAADLGRRDFTMNAMAIRLSDAQLLDPYDGRGDMDLRCVRMVAPENFDDDPLRCLKAVRMAVKFGFEIDHLTILAIQKRADFITRIAAERVTFELSIIFSSGAFRQAIKHLRELQLDVPLFGRELDPDRYRADDVSLAGAYAILVDDPKGYAKRWRWSIELTREVTSLQALCARRDLVSLYDCGERISRQLPAMLRTLGRHDDVAMPDFTARPLLSGDEIAAATGLTEGPELGRRKRALLEAQIRREVKSRDEALTFISSDRPARHPL